MTGTAARVVREAAVTAGEMLRPAAVLGRLRARREWMFLASLRRGHAGLAAAWWTLLALRAALPAVFALTMGALVSAVTGGRSLAVPLVLVGIVFVAMQVLTPIHQAVSQNLGDRTAAWLYDQLSDAAVGPPGVGHLEDSGLAKDMITAREFDLGMHGPPLSLSMDFIADGFVTLLSGLACSVVLFGFAWWAPFVLAGAWLATHWLLRESGVWRDRNTDEVRSAQQEANYAYQLAVEAPAAKEVRLFGLADWVIARFTARRRQMHDLQYEATRLREKSVLASLVIVLAGNAAVFAALGLSLAGGRISLGAAVAFAQAAIGTSSIAFGGLNWALDGAAAPVKAVATLLPAMAAAGALGPPPATAADRMVSESALSALPAREIRVRNLTFAYPGSDVDVLRGFDLTIPAGSSLAIVGRNGAGKTTLAKLLCRLYDPRHGSIEVDGIDIRLFDVTAWRSRITAVFQDFVRFELPLRDNVAPMGAPDDDILAALAAAGAADLADLSTVLAKGYPGGTDLSGGQWQRIALARALAAVRQGAGLVLLDEPTAQLDARGEAEIFSRILAETRGCTTVLVSHRFSTVRHADRICVVEGGAVVELGSHDELIARGGRYRTMFDLQAQRFAEGQPADEDDEEIVYDTLA
ncbi:MAG TPA: ATP-binding cassette domain-containing protein [Micromonosporaceae bacterium]|nr:ATP-binding cassette domain-containing protein [Micromonosporaceae bacterium]